MSESTSGPGLRDVERADQERYRSIGLTTYPMGNEQELVALEGSGVVKLLPISEVDSLVSCGSFRTLEEHAGDLCRQFGLAPYHLPSILFQLAKHARSGLMVSRRELRKRVASREGGLPSVPPIGTLGIVTRNRPEALDRCVRSYADNLKRHGRSCRLVIVDDSDTPAARDGARSFLASARKEFGGEIRYAGTEEKRRYRALLEKESGVAPEILDDVFSPRDEARFKAGANRNALYLSALGERFVSVDDDTECRLAMTPEPDGNRLSLSSKSQPLEVWFHPDLKTAMGSVTVGDADYLSDHEELLSQDPWKLAARTDDAALGLDAMDGRFLRMLESRDGRVRLTQNGLVGDCGVGTSGWLTTMDGPSRDRLLRSKDVYETARRSREVIRAVRSTTVSNGSFFMTYSAGFDGRELLPPFMPIGRFEDGIFSITLLKMFDHTAVGHLPRLVVHAPWGGREFRPEDTWAAASSVFIHDIIGCSIVGFEVGPAKQAGSARLRALGRHLVELGTQPQREFEKFIRMMLWQRASRTFEEQERLIGEYSEGAPYWAEDLQKAQAELKSSLPRREHVIPKDLSAHRDSEEAAKLSQALVARLGRLYQAWPELVEAASALRKHGADPSEAV